MTQHKTIIFPELSSEKKLCEVPAQSLAVKSTAVWENPKDRMKQNIISASLFFIIGNFI